MSPIFLRGGGAFLTGIPLIKKNRMKKYENIKNQFKTHKIKKIENWLSNPIKHARSARPRPPPTATISKKRSSRSRRRCARRSTTGRAPCASYPATALPDFEVVVFRTFILTNNFVNLHSIFWNFPINFVFDHYPPYREPLASLVAASVFLGSNLKKIGSEIWREHF